MLQMG